MASGVHFCKSPSNSLADQSVVSIVIVNWNSAAELTACLESIYRYPPRCEFEILVVDNASFDGSDRLICEKFSSVNFLQLEQNVGFSRANNLLAAQAEGDILLFLNPDTEVEAGALEQLAAVLRAKVDAGAVGGTLLNSDGSLQTSCISTFPTLVNQALDSDLLRRWFPKSRLWGIRPLFEHDDLAEVDSISGACLMVSRTAFEEVERFSEEYFMYSEDVDLCFKLKRAGYRNYYVRKARVTHHGGRSSDSRSERAFAAVAMRESRRKFLRKTKGEVYALLYRILMMIAAIGRIAVLRLVSLIPGKGNLRASGAVGKWTAILKWSFARNWSSEAGSGQ